MNQKQVFDVVEYIMNSDLNVCKSDAISLYMTYYAFQLKKANVSWLPVPKASSLLNISVHRVRKARKLLQDMGLIEDTAQKDKMGTVRHFVQMNYPNEVKKEVCAVHVST